MARVLLVEDSSTQALQIQMMLEEEGFSVELAANGEEALEAILREPPDLVVTDLDMPGMNGLQLLEVIRRDHHPLPVILITGYGSEEIAVQSLQKGASNYVPKRNLTRDLVTTIDEVLVMASAHRHEDWVLESLRQTESYFVLGNNQDLIPPLIGYLQQNLRKMGLCDEIGLVRIAVAVNEALTNAIFHGNLDVSAELQERD